MKRIVIAAAIVVGSAAFSSSAFAFTATNPASDSFHVGLVVEDECTITTTAIDFQDIGIITSAIPGTGTVTVQCTHTTPYQITLTAGHSNDTSDRTMAGTGGNSDVVHYQLYSD